MENYIVEGSKKTPSIFLSTSGTITIGGRSIHEDPDNFFQPIVDWILAYCKEPPVEETSVNIELEYFNSGSAKFILSILQVLTTKMKEGHHLKIYWHYEAGDDDILERGQYYSSLLDKEFIFVLDE